jgi:hypothetical protein
MFPNRRHTGMGRTARRPLRRLMLALAFAGLPHGAHAQWQTQTESGRGEQPALAPSMPAPVLTPMPDLRPAAPAMVPPNTTVVPRSTQEPRAPAAAAPGGGGGGQLSLSALLTQDGQSIDQGLVWRVFSTKPGPDGKPRLVVTNREANPVLKLDAGEYVVNVAFGRANLTRKVTVSGDRAVQERFVLNAGGLRLTPTLARGEAVNERTFVYDIYSDERDQYGQRTKVMGGVRPGVVLRLNAGIYNVVGTYGDANATVRADVTVEAGKLTEATINHAAAKVTFKLVAQPGGDAIADTQWTVATDQGETVKESVGALPTHIFAPGTYVVSAKNGGGVFQRRFTVRAGDVGQVEVLRR